MARECFVCLLQCVSEGMGESYGAQSAQANKTAAENSHDGPAGKPENKSGGILPDLWFARMCRELWKFKVAAHLHFLSGRSDRTCRAWAAGENDSDATMLAVILRSDHGYRALKFVMRGSDATWWIILQAAISDISKLAAD